MADNSISRSQLKEVLDTLRTLPDFDRLALPANIHKEFNIPMTGYASQTLMEFYAKHAALRMAGGEKGEVRGPTLGPDGKPIIRPIVFLPEVKLEISSEKILELEETSSPTTANGTQDSPQCPDESNPPASGAE